MDDNERRELAKLWIWKRGFTFADEWLWYCVLIWLWRSRAPRWLLALILGYGGLATLTSYKNLEVLENRLGIRGWFFWPICR